MGQHTRTIAGLLGCMICLCCLLGGCTKAEPVAAEGFVMAAEKHGYSVSQQQPTQDDSWTAAYGAQEKDAYTLIYYTFQDEDAARSYYQSGRQYIDKQISSSRQYVETNLPHKNRYSVRSNGVSYVICRITNTVIYAAADRENAVKIKALLQELKY